MKIKVNKISMRPDIDWTKGRPAVCDGDVAFTEMKMTLKSVALVWNGSEWMAFAPRLNRMGEGIMWDAGGSFAKEIAQHLLEAYQRMGGQMPPRPKPERQFIPIHQLKLSEDDGIPILRRIEDALDEETERRGVPCFTETFGLTTADVKAAADYAAEGHDEADDVEGLHRILGISAVEETMERAGL